MHEYHLIILLTQEEFDNHRFIAGLSTQKLVHFTTLHIVLTPVTF